MLAALKDRYGVDAKLIAGHGGIFEVKVDGKVVFDKFTSNRFPEEQEIFELIDKLKN